MRSLFVYFILSIWLYALPQAIAEEIRKSGIPQKDISIYIKEVGKNGKTIASLNADVPRTPASVIKVLSTYASVLKLGFDYRWPTKFYTTGTLKNGILHGDLLVKGFGDPTLNAEDLETIVSDIRAKGIRQIRGDIVIDRTYFQVGDQDNSGFDQYTYSAYNAMPDAMMFNERVVTVSVIPKENKVVKKHVDESYKVVNQLQRVNTPCKGQYSWPRVKIDKSSSVTPTVLLSGKISKQCGKRNICQVITKPYKSFYYAFKDRLIKEGITVNGGYKLEKIPSNAKALFTHYSDTLEEIISKTAKESNNLYARHLMLFAGAQLYGTPATMQKGRDAVRYILDTRGALGEGVLKIDNGSGLSRTSKMTAKILAKMYDHAYDSYGKRWMDTLSIAGVDGTIKRRFRYSVVKNHAWMKTGTLKNVKNIGGYVQNRAGKLYTVVILTEGPRARYYASKLQDDIITWLVKTSAKSTMRTSTAPIVKPSHTIVQQKAPVQSKPSTEVKTKATVKKQHVTAKSSPMYYVQVGSFSAMPNERLLSSIKGLGLNYTIKHEKNYKVLVGGYKDEKSARQVLNKVRNRIHKGAFIVKL